MPLPRSQHAYRSETNPDVYSNLGKRSGSTKESMTNRFPAFEKSRGTQRKQLREPGATWRRLPAGPVGRRTKLKLAYQQAIQLVRERNSQSPTQADLKQTWRYIWLSP